MRVSTIWNMAKSAFVNWWTLPATIAGMFFVDKMLIPEGTPGWVTPTMYAVAMGSNILGNMAGQNRAREEAEKLKDETSALGIALAVERERTNTLTESLDSTRTLREADNDVYTRRLEKLRERHDSEMAALREHHKEEEKSLRMHHNANETLLRAEIGKSNSLRESDRTISQGRIEELIKENGRLLSVIAWYEGKYGKAGNDCEVV